MESFEEGRGRFAPRGAQIIKAVVPFAKGFLSADSSPYCWPGVDFRGNRGRGQPAERKSVGMVPTYSCGWGMRRNRDFDLFELPVRGVYREGARRNGDERYNTSVIFHSGVYRRADLLERGKHAIAFGTRSEMRKHYPIDFSWPERENCTFIFGLPGCVIH